MAVAVAVVVARMAIAVDGCGLKVVSCKSNIDDHTSHY